MLKNDAVSTLGNVNGTSIANVSATAHNATGRRRREAEPPRVSGAERPEAFDDRDRDVGKDGHLEQLDEAVRRPLERQRALAEEEPHHDAQGKADEDLAGEGHRESGFTLAVNAAASAGFFHSV